VKTDLRIAFGVVIKKLREKNNLTQEELGDLADMSRPYISDLERGVYNPTLNIIYKLAEVLKIKPGSLIDKVDAIVNRKTKSRPSSK
jgi:transcriptional regulator with XRE-family HTH domain